MNLLSLFGATFVIVINNGVYGIAKSTSQDLYALRDRGQRNLKSVSLTCLLPSNLTDEIASYQWLVDNVSSLVLNGPLKGVAYRQLATFVDNFGPRFTGSEALENSIDYLVDFLNQSGLDNVHTENATVPIWKRGNESLQMIQPRFRELALLGLGSSVGTPSDGITAEIIVVQDFDELDSKASQVPGKIVVYNQPYYSYGQSVQYRSQGAAMAAKYGAVAALVRSVTPRSIYSPHTGWQYYDDSVSPNHIPVACITVEDAEMFQRMQERGTTVVLKLSMQAENFPDGISRNTIAERTGAISPEEVVIVSGHLDSWDVGQGAMDDGAGAFISLMVPYVLKDLGLRPRRTLRSVLWTAEEPGWYGAEAYSAAHTDELPNMDIVMESDEGTFDPRGLAFSGTDDAACIIQEILKLTASLNATELIMPDDGSDTTVFSQLGIPVADLRVQDTHYYDYHHSNGDTMTVEDPDELDRCLVFWTVTSYVLADISVRLPRENNTNAV